MHKSHKNFLYFIFIACRLPVLCLILSRIKDDKMTLNNHKEWDVLDAIFIDSVIFSFLCKSSIDTIRLFAIDNFFLCHARNHLSELFLTKPSGLDYHGSWVSVKESGASLTNGSVKFDK